MRLLPIPLLLVCGCTLDTTVDETDTTTTAIEGGALASAYHIARAVKIPGCTATRIGHRWAITAAHCASAVGQRAEYYDDATETSTRGAEIAEVLLPAGVTVNFVCIEHGRCPDANGDHGDMALLRLTSSSTNDAAMVGPNATLAWDFPGAVSALQVGAGKHYELNNPSGMLFQVANTIESSTDSNGDFRTAAWRTNHGDSGGPIYVANQVVGVLTGSGDDTSGGFSTYTSVPYRLDWILSTIGYRWQGAPPRIGYRYSGTTIETFSATARVCQYACEQTERCEAYNHSSEGDCRLIDDVSGTELASGRTSALAHAGPTGIAGPTVGYTRADGATAMVHRLDNGGIEEVRPGWSQTNIRGGAPTPDSSLSAYRRSDGYDAVVYRSAANELVELYRTGSTWTYGILPDGPTFPAGAPVGFVRADGENAVVYRTSDNRIRELRLETTGWTRRDLTTDGDCPVLASSDPSALRRADGFTSIVFRAGTDIWELYQRVGEPWYCNNVSSNVAGWAPPASGRPHAFRHSDGTTAIVYRTTGNLVMQLRLVDGVWSRLQIGGQVTSDPIGHVRTDAIESVIARGAGSTGGDVLEMANSGGWTTWNLSTYGGPLVNSPPTAFLNSAGESLVIYEDADLVHVLRYRPGAPWSYTSY